MTVRYMIKLVRSELSGYPNSLGASLVPQWVRDTTGIPSDCVSQEALSGPTWTGTGFVYPTTNLPQTVTDANCDGIKWPFGDQRDRDYIWRKHNGSRLMPAEPPNSAWPPHRNPFLLPQGWNDARFPDLDPSVTDPANPPNWPCTGLLFWEVQRGWLDLLFKDGTDPVTGSDIPIGQLDRWIGGVKSSDLSNGLHPPGPGPLPQIDPSPIAIVATCDDTTSIVRRSGGVPLPAPGGPMDGNAIAIPGTGGGRWPWIICQSATVVLAQQMTGATGPEWVTQRQVVWDWLQANLP